MLLLEVQHLLADLEVGPLLSDSNSHKDRFSARILPRQLEQLQTFSDNKPERHHLEWLLPVPQQISVPLDKHLSKQLLQASPPQDRLFLVVRRKLHSRQLPLVLRHLSRLAQQPLHLGILVRSHNSLLFNRFSVQVPRLEHLDKLLPPEPHLLTLAHLNNRHRLHLCLNRPLVLHLDRLVPHLPLQHQLLVVHNQLPI